MLLMNDRSFLYELRAYLICKDGRKVFLTINRVPIQTVFIIALHWLDMTKILLNEPLSHVINPATNTADHAAVTTLQNGTNSEYPTDFCDGLFHC